jgi:hypothetical protein
MDQNIKPDQNKKGHQGKEKENQITMMGKARKSEYF